MDILREAEPPDNGSSPANGTLDAALNYLRAGFSLFPVRRDGSKAPSVSTWNPQKMQPPSEPKVRTWYDVPAPPGIALVHGRVSGGTEVIDFDEEAERIYPEWSFLVESESPGLLDRLTIIKTPREHGRHVIFRCTEIEIPGATKLAMAPRSTSDKPNHKETLIETRGTDSYAIAPGSPPECHETHRLYRHESGPPLTALTLITAGEREILIRAAQSFDASKSPESVQKPTGINVGELRPGDDYSQRTSIDDIAKLLVRAGWTHVRGHHWRRPGKTIGWSATLGYCKNCKGEPLFCVFTSSSAFPGPSGGKPCSCHPPFGVYAILEHAGDFRNAARELRNQGYGATAPAVPKQTPSASAPANASASPPTTKPVVIVDCNEAEVNDACIPHLARHPRVFQRACMLVSHIQESKATKIRGIRRVAGAHRTVVLSTASIREMLTACIDFKKYKKRPGSNELELIACRPHEMCSKQIADRGQWQDVRHLEAIVETPPFLPTGEVVTTPGYHNDSGLLFLPAMVFPPVPATPTRADAVASARVILDLVQDFPFALLHHKAAWLAALLTVFAMSAIDGPVPLFLIDANIAGSGKSKLCDLIAIISTGRDMPRIGWTEDDDEMRKTIAALALDGLTFCMFDNIEAASVFGSAVLDQALTARTVQARILGITKMTPELPWNTVCFATGNNLLIKGDGERRIIFSRLESKHECPEERTVFAHANLNEYVKQNRAAIVVHCLTILKAFVAAGKPSKLPAYGSFEAWSDLVRGAVVWVEEAFDPVNGESVDPCAGKSELKRSNTQKSLLPNLMKEWQLLGAVNGMTAAEVIQAIRDDEGSADDATKNRLASLRAILCELSPKGDLPTSPQLGIKLRAFKEQVVGGQRFVIDGERRGTSVWKLERVTEMQAPQAEAAPQSQGGASQMTSQEQARQQAHKGIVDAARNGDVMAARHLEIMARTKQ